MSILLALENLASDVVRNFKDLPPDKRGELILEYKKMKVTILGEAVETEILSIIFKIDNSTERV